MDSKPLKLFAFTTFDGGIFSFKTKSVKADGGLYEILIQKFNPITHQEILLIDDRETNLIKQQKSGFNILLFSTTKKLIDDLKIKGMLF